MDDAFLDLGGDSLLAARVVSRVRDRFGLGIDVAGLLRARTPADMAAAVAEHLLHAATARPEGPGPGA